MDDIDICLDLERHNIPVNGGAFHGYLRKNDVFWNFALPANYMN